MIEIKSDYLIDDAVTACQGEICAGDGLCESDGVSASWQLAST